MDLFEIVKARDGHDTLAVTDGNKKYFLHSLYYPEKEGQEWADMVQFDDEAIILVYGIGLGYHINFLARKLSLSNRLILVEPSKEIFEYALVNGYYDEFKERPNTFFINEGSDENMRNLLSMYIPWDNFENLVYRDFKQYPKIFEDHYRMFSKCLIETINAMRINRNTALYFASQWQSNFMENIEFVFKSVPVKSFFNSFKNVPAVIVSAGPSLDKNIRLLKEAKGKSIIICVGTALKALLKEKIEPDFVVSIDGSEKNFRHFEGCSVNIPLLYDLTVYPQILKEYKGPLIIGQIASEFSALFERKLSLEFGSLNAGPSVANLSLDFAYKMGCNPIIFIGQDLAYLNNRTHASGTTYEKDRIKGSSDEKEYIYVDGNYGEKVLTDRVLLSFKTWFENYICKHPNRIYINATEGGAFIKGTEVMDFKNVIDKYMKKNLHISQKINEIVANKKIALKPEQINFLYTELEGTIKRLKIIKWDCLRGAKLSKKMYNEYEKDINADTTRILKILDKIDAKLRDSKESFLLISSILNIVTTKILKGFKTEKDETEKEKKLRISMMSYTLYYGIYEAILQSEKGLEKALNTIKSINSTDITSLNIIREDKYENRR
ncbi:motility associated factor glycosyltransferase family protein [Thermoanaerobacter mathranii]|uniref:motility associated factor glycosyltransferase family protein n=1 Tax=Thermoanaerobacter mathranii TaxID=583357 RepID=UPI003AAF67AC